MCIKVDQFKTIFQQIGLDVVVKLLNDEKVGLVDIQILVAVLKQVSYYITDMDQVIALSKKCKKVLHIDNLVKQSDTNLVC